MRVPVFSEDGNWQSCLHHHVTDFSAQTNKRFMKAAISMFSGFPSFPITYIFDSRNLVSTHPVWRLFIALTLLLHLGIAIASVSSLSRFYLVCSRHFSPMIHERSSRQAPTDLQLYPFSKWDSARDLPSPFLGGSAPRLRSLVLENIPILASLRLQNIPQLGYISCFH